MKPETEKALKEDRKLGNDTLNENGGKKYIAIDLKSFYASVECVDRGLDPLKANLVVADTARTEKTICLAVSPSLKAYGIPGRVRLFEVNEKVRQVNSDRKSQGRTDMLEYIAAKPRMARYMEVSRQIYGIYLRFIAPEDIHVYSVDEVFMDVTAYLNTYNMTAHELAIKIIREVLAETGITATAGIGTNMYLSKIAMDIVAKKMPADKDGVRIAELDEMSYRRELWEHRPLRDFWRVGRGISEKLEKMGLYTMGDVARCSIGKATDYYNEDLLYKAFGINAELLIDHAWGYEPCPISEIKAYKPDNNSISQGQVLQSPYEFEKAKLVVREMAELLALDIVEKGLVTDQVVLTVGYDISNLNGANKNNKYDGEVTEDRYGRKIPKNAHGSENVGMFTSSSKMLVEAVVRLFERIVDSNLLVRRMYVVFNHVIKEEAANEIESYEQFDLFTDYEALEKEKQAKKEELERERKMQDAVIALKKKFGKNAVLKGMNLSEGATTIMRNNQIGGHNSGDEED